MSWKESCRGKVTKSYSLLFASICSSQ